MSDIVQQYDSPMMEDGMQGVTSKFTLGGIPEASLINNYGASGSPIYNFGHGGTTNVNNPLISKLLSKYATKPPYQDEYANGGDLLGDEPAIYVADLAAYNEGRLEGFWLRLSDFDNGHEVMLEIADFLKKQSKRAGELREEYAIHDYQNFPYQLYSEYMAEDDFDKIIEAYKIHESYGIPFNVILEVQKDYGITNLEEIRERFFTQTSGDNEDKELGMAYVDELGWDSVANKDYYFDYEDYGSDVRQDFDEEDEKAYGDLSNYEVGEMFVELSGGLSNMSNSTIESYFDYESFGGDLSIDDFVSYKGSDKNLYWFYRNYKKGGKLSKGKYADGGATKKKGYDLYHETLAATLDEVEDFARRNDYTLGEYDKTIQHVAYGTTWRASAPCFDEAGKQLNTIQVQIYRMDSGKYELNMYFSKKSKKKDDTEYLFDGEPLPFAKGGETQKDTITLIFDGKKHTYNATFIDGEFEDVYIAKSADDNPLWDYIENDWNDWYDHESENNKELEEMYYGEEAIYSKKGAIRQAIDDVADQIADELKRNPNKTTFNLDKGDVEIGANYYADGGLFADGGEMEKVYAIVDDGGEVVYSYLNEDAVIEKANEIFYYDQKDNDEFEISSFEEAVAALESMDYRVVENMEEEEVSSDNYGGAFGKGGQISKGDSVQVIAENKSGVVTNVIADGKHYSVRFVDGSKNVYDKDELERILSEEDYDEFNDGGEFDSLEEVEKHAKKLSKTYGKIYIFKRQSGSRKGKYVTATEEDAMAELYGSHNSAFVALYGNGKKYAENGAEVENDSLLSKVRNSTFKDRVQMLKDNPQVFVGGVPTKFADGGGIHDETIPFVVESKMSYQTIFALSEQEAREIWEKRHKGDTIRDEIISVKKKSFDDNTKKETYTHKHIPNMTLEVVQTTSKGIKGLQKDPKSLSPKERKEGKIVFYSKRELEDLWNKDEMKLGGVTKKVKRVVRGAKKYTKLAVKKAKPTARKVIKKAKIGFEALANKVAKAYEGKAVKPKYQSEYGKRYSKAEAKEVGNKVAAKVKKLKGL